MRGINLKKIEFNERGMCFFKNRIVKKYPWPNRDITKWFDLYQQYQEFDSRVIKVLSVNLTERYYEMESIQGLTIEKQLFQLDFDKKKKILLEVMDIFQNFFKFKSELLKKTESFIHLDLRSDNILYTGDVEASVKLIDPDSFTIVSLNQMNNTLYFGRYTDTLYDLKEKLSYDDLDTRQLRTIQGRLGRKK